jgi:hypothetical protein
MRRELDNLDEFLKLNASLAPEMVSAWGRTTAIASAIANVYNGIENVLADIAKAVDGSVPSGETSHQDLLDQMWAEVAGTRAAVLDERLHAQLTELKGFRHRVRHNYGFDLDPARTDENLERLRQVFPAFVEALRTLERAMTAEENR